MSVNDRPYPGGARFAFTILDDTDDATVSNVKPVYDLLHELGMRTTKTVWPLACPEGSPVYFAAETLEAEGYRAFMQEIVARGFEVASHGATMESSLRERTIAGLDALEAHIGASPVIHCNHGQNRENIYWGAERYRSLALRLPMAALARLRRGPRFEGHVPSSPYFWGDVCRERFRFVRGFTFTTLDSGAIPPRRPYRMRSTPWVNYWFNTADAPDARQFVELVTPARVDRLVADGGLCILSTHLGKGFTRDGRVLPAVERALRHLASHEGWFPTVSTILEWQLATAASHDLTPWTRWGLEIRHVADRVRQRSRLTSSVA